jgi:hypothetical protein
MERKRSLFFFRNYFNEFLEVQPEKVKCKIDYVLFLIATAERIPRKFFPVSKEPMDYMKSE